MRIDGEMTELPKRSIDIGALGLAERPSVDGQCVGCGKVREICCDDRGTAPKCARCCGCGGGL